MDPAFAKDLDAFSSKVLFLTNQLLELAATIDPSGKGKGKVRSEDDILDSFETLIVDRMDQLLECVDISLDEYQSKTKPPAIAINLLVELSSVKQKNNTLPTWRSLTKFKVLVDNCNTPWYPRLKQIPRASFSRVFHGADSDIVWLQQDLNLYIVNLFNTYHASQISAFPKHGLAHMLEMHCDFLPDKRYQLADWRLRPLPQEMLKYPRSDIHFLLFIYNNLRNALLDRGESQARSQALEGGPLSSPVSNGSLLREVFARS
ncbi:ribonuclease H-like domain-containing protein [Armillaria borealis]|uniref:Ribonuclease H-like domain-containing protein n=1 Tax=Armillaria borealis TaxID=47425 RepID=A0AA39JXQ8_9AGAR|nr:ribonuclease H-like domain-containing protein [Armillaria borealis]